MEEWVKWEPLTGLAKNYDISSISFSHEALTLLLSSEKIEDAMKKKLHIVFESPLFLNRTDDSLALVTPVKKRIEQGRWTFFKIFNSSLLKKLLPEVDQEQELSHYVIVDENSILTVVVSNKPHVEWVKNGI